MFRAPRYSHGMSESALSIVRGQFITSSMVFRDIILVCYIFNQAYSQTEVQYARRPSDRPTNRPHDLCACTVREATSHLAGTCHL